MDVAISNKRPTRSCCVTNLWSSQIDRENTRLVLCDSIILGIYHFKSAFLKMRSQLIFLVSSFLVLFFFVSEISAICYVPNRVCTNKVLGFSLFKADCGLQCKQKDEKKCSSVSLFHTKKDTGNVILQAYFPMMAKKMVYFNVTLLQSDWETFKVKVTSDSPKVQICMKYSNKDRPLPSLANLQIKLMDDGNYALHENKDVVLQYEIKNPETTVYGKFVYRVPNFHRFVHEYFYY